MGQYIKSARDLPTDPTLLAKFKCHPTIPCDIPISLDDLDALWYHIPDDLLPTNWSSDWLDFSPSKFLPCSQYSMGRVDILLKADYGIPYPIKGVIYCTVDRIEPGGLFEEQLPPGNPECIVFQDAIGDYYFYYEFSQGGDEYLAKFRAPRGTTVSDFVKDHFRGGVKGVDMDLVLPRYDSFKVKLWREQQDLAALHEWVRAHSHCACWLPSTSRDAKLKNLRPVS